VTKTIYFSVVGDSDAELEEKARDFISLYLNLSMGEDEPKVQYEFFVKEDVDFEAEFTYRADVIVRIKKI
jgi:hypothetical protein